MRFNVRIALMFVVRLFRTRYSLRVQSIEAIFHINSMCGTTTFILRKRIMLCVDSISMKLLGINKEVDRSKIFFLRTLCMTQPFLSPITE